MQQPTEDLHALKMHYNHKYLVSGSWLECGLCFVVESLLLFLLLLMRNYTECALLRCHLRFGASGPTEPEPPALDVFTLIAIFYSRHAWRVLPGFALQPRVFSLQTATKTNNRRLLFIAALLKNRFQPLIRVSDFLFLLQPLISPPPVPRPPRQ